MDSALGDSPALLTVGVTGHRDIWAGSVDTFRSAVERILTTLVEAAPHTSVIFISGLAEGVDQEAAEVAVSIPTVRVLAACPMTLQEYRNDFEGTALARFDDLVSRCDGVVEVLPRVADGQTHDQVDRDTHYQHFGRWLARNCQILIAGWDGSSPELIGGTADNVYFKAEGLSPLPSAHAALDPTPPDPGLIIWNPVQRQHPPTTLRDKDQVRDPAPTCLFRVDGEWSEWFGDFGKDLQTIDAFNAESTVQDGESQQTRRLFEAADQVASLLQARYRRVLKSIMVSGVLALAAIDALQATGRSVFAIVLIAMLTISASLWFWLRRSRLSERFQQARALAEGARIQLVWLAAGLNQGAADSFLASQGSQVEWIRAALRSAWLVDTKVDPESRSNEPDFEVGLEWLDEQVSYFSGGHGRTGAIRRAWLKHRSMRRRATAFFSVAVVALILNMASIIFALPWDSWLMEALPLMWSVGLGIGIAIVSYSELMGFSQLGQRYSLTVPYLRQGRDDLWNAVANDSIAAAQGVLRAAGTEALREAGDWLVLHSQRQVRPV